ncbi:hypothetical protein [uncultured Brachyspira sp.]|uniref:hypothetical protein n=1 Tax=uncultured Brachyspira sp. TaxID=221953 RepID=UPI002582E6AF|nr:hypothetical protein [uncultured Brachyspira sp.]
MELSKDKQYIYLELNKSKNEVAIDIKNIDMEDLIYLLSELICHVSKKDNIVPHLLLTMISKTIEIKKELEKTDIKDYSRNPLEGNSKNVYWNLFSNDRLIEFYNNASLEEGYKNYIKNELNKRGITDLSIKIDTKNAKQNKNNKKEKSNKDNEIDKKNELKKELKEKQGHSSNESFAEQMKNNNDVISFGEEDNAYKVDEVDDEEFFFKDDEGEDPFSVDLDNIRNWDSNEVPNNIDEEGNKYLFSE